MDYSPPILRFLSVCQVSSPCELFLDGIDILKGIKNTNYKLSIIYVVLGVSYFVSYFEFHFINNKIYK